MYEGDDKAQSYCSFTTQEYYVDIIKPSPKILIVDDDLNSHQLFRKVFEQSGLKYLFEIMQMAFSRMT